LISTVLGCLNEQEQATCHPNENKIPNSDVFLLINALDVKKDIFCDEDGTREFNKSLVCPACKYKDQSDPF